MTLSAIIPALNEERHIGRPLQALANAPEVAEVIVVDGGSRDQTPAVARAAGARVLASSPGRGIQMATGATAARGNLLWFLHADTIPSPGSAAAVLAAMKDPSVAGGNCVIAFDGCRRCARFLTWLYPRLRVLGLLYGDSGIFVRRDFYERCGGFRPYPIFEDLDLIRRLRRHGTLAYVAPGVTTSSRRFEHTSFARTFAFWSWLQALYWCGASPRWLGELYYSSKRKGRSDSVPAGKLAPKAGVENR